MKVYEIMFITKMEEKKALRVLPGMSNLADQANLIYVSSEFNPNGKFIAKTESEFITAKKMLNAKGIKFVGSSYEKYISKN
jgi:hypothetical protein